MAVIGLEVHCQLTGLRSKLFCPCRADYRGMEPNTNVCPVCLGLPGALPRLNRAAVEGAVTVALALGCTVPPRLSFFRKNYFYPDLPKNYQITQLDLHGPSSAGAGGSLEAGGRAVRIRRVQLEEDPGRLVHEGEGGARVTLADYNRAGVPLVEIVTEPDLGGPGHVREFLGELSGLLGGLGVADPSLEGAMRADGNVSVGGGPRVELKNVASFHDLERALRYEVTRQESTASRGIAVERETRQWDGRRRITVPARGKEDEEDYRYMAEADVPRVRLEGADLARLRAAIPEGAAARAARYAALGVPRQVAGVLSADRRLSAVFEEAHTPENARELANMLATDLAGLAGAGALPPAEQLAGLAGAVAGGRTTRAAARAALQEMVRTGATLEEAAGRLGPGGAEDGAALEAAVAGVLADEAAAAEQARANPKAVNYLVGRVMARTGGRADPARTLELIRAALAAGG